MSGPRDGCQVWVASLSELRLHEQELAGVLLPAERVDLGGHADPTTSTLSRAALRLVLADHLGVRPEQVEIDRRCPVCGRPHGRPRLTGDPRGGAAPPQLSVAHGGDLLVLALAGRGPLGVDVEPDPPGGAVTDDLVELALTPPERRHLASVPRERQHRLFLHYWTGKEAVLKALGTGLDRSLQTVTLPAAPDDGTTVVEVPGSGPVGLAVRHLDVGPAHVCALATAEPAADVSLSRLSAAALLDPSRR